MAKGRRLKKVGGDLEAQKYIVFSSKLTIGEQNDVPSKPRVDESSNPCDLDLAMVVCNSNDEIIFDTNWEFQSKSGGLDCFKIYIH
jgi:hypothetical protein